MTDLQTEIYNAMKPIKSGWTVFRMRDFLNFYRKHKLTIVEVADAMLDLSDKRLIQLEYKEYFVRGNK